MWEKNARKHMNGIANTAFDTNASGALGFERREKCLIFVSFLSLSLTHSISPVRSFVYHVNRVPPFSSSSSSFHLVILLYAAAAGKFSAGIIDKGELYKAVNAI